MTNEPSQLVRQYKGRGIIFRDDAYWNRYVIYDEHFKEIFDRKLDVEAGIRLFRHSYRRFLGQYSAYCGDYIPAGSPGVRYTEKTTMQDGWSTYEFTTHIGDLLVKPRFWDKFVEYGKDLDINVDTSSLKAIMNSAQLNKQFFTWLNDDIKLLLDSEKCNSGFMQQFEENLWRLAYSQTVLQNDPLKYKYADDEPASR